ncbi:acyltransferase, partial [uncultured Rhodoblastus sp.]|uniref:acyltransferase family protein n=1 Tax=uncultured Rhodoblastus sp. TaxID=543037 RepID=UPI0025E09E86
VAGITQLVAVVFRPVLARPHRQPLPNQAAFHESQTTRAIQLLFGRTLRLDSRWEVLALTRFILAFIVMVGHENYFIDLLTGWSKFGLWLNQGSAVFGFLIISGYSIAASLDRQPDGFFWRRVTRIYPTYIVAIVLAIAVSFLLKGKIIVATGDNIPPPTFLEIFSTVFMLQSFVSRPIPLAGQLWTVAIEWWNYILAPYFAKLKAIPLYIFGATSLLYNITTCPPDASVLKYGLAFIAVSWYWVSGFLYYKHRKSPIGYVVLFTPVIMASVSGTFVGRAVIIAVVAIALCEELPVGPKLSIIFRWLGDISYPIYAYHVAVIFGLYSIGVHSSVILTCVVITLSALSLHWIERPIQGMMNKVKFPLIVFSYYKSRFLNRNHS